MSSRPAARLLIEGEEAARYRELPKEHVSAALTAARKRLPVQVGVAAKTDKERNDNETSWLLGWATPETHSAYIDDTSGDTLIARKFVPLAPSIAATLKPTETLAMLRELVTSKPDTSAVNEALTLAAQKIPSTMIEVVRAAKPRHVIIAPTGFQLSSTANTVALTGNIIGALVLGVGAGVALAGFGLVAAVGLGAATALGAFRTAHRRIPMALHPMVRLGAALGFSRDGLSGLSSAHDSAVTIVAKADDAKTKLAYVLAHELAHVVDGCLVRHGQLTDEPEFLAIWEATTAAYHEGLAAPAFPSEYAASHPAEFFAEAVAAYLDLAWWGQMGRADLRQRNPQLYAYMERLFAERIPQALRDGTVQGHCETLPSDVEHDPLAPARRELAKADINHDATALAAAERELAKVDTRTLNAMHWRDQLFGGQNTLSLFKKKLAMVKAAFAESDR